MSDATGAQRERALRLLDDGRTAVEVAAALGVPASTVRSWRRRAGKSAPPAGADPTSWAEQKEQGAREAWDAAQHALRQVRAELRAGDPRKAQAAALSFAILTDKSGVLETAAAHADERQVRLAEGHGQLVAAVLETFMSAVGLPAARGGATGRLLADLLRRSGAGEPIAASPDLAEAAAREVREHFRPPAAAVAPERRALPAPRPHPDGHDEHEQEVDMVGPRRVVRALRERRRKREEAEVVEGVVVAAAPKRSRGQRAVEEAAGAVPDVRPRVDWDADDPETVRRQLEAGR
jgi:transposase-like protein